MTIDEAIAMVNNRAIICEHSYDRFIQLEKKQWEQVSEWLEELKKYRTLDKTNFSDGYIKAIDDCIKEVEEEEKQHNHTITKDCLFWLKRKFELLKEGVRNDD